MEKYHQLTFQLRKKAIPNMRTRNTTPTTPCGLNFSLCCMSRSPFNKILTSEWQAIARNAMGQPALAFNYPPTTFQIVSRLAHRLPVAGALVLRLS